MKEILRRLKARKKQAAEIGLASFTINFLGLTSSIYSIVVLRRYLAVGIDSTLVTLSVGALLAVAFEFALRSIRVLLARDICNESDRELSEASFAALSTGRYATLSRLPVEQQREMLSGLSTVQQAYGPFNMLALYDAPFSVLYLLVLFFISPILAGLASVLAGLGLYSSWRAQTKLREPAKNLTRENALLGSYSNSLIVAADAVRIFSWTRTLREKWSEKQGAVEKIRSDLLYHQNMAQQYGLSSGMLLSIVMMGVGSKIVMAGDLTVATLIGGNILAGRALSNVNRLAQTVEQFARADQHMTQLRALAALEREKERGTRLHRVQGRITIHDVGFMYPDTSSPLFESANLEVNPGDILVVSGANGSGKTTLAKLVCGLMEPQRGEIRLDGVNTRQLDPYWFRSRISYLPQEPFFFNGTFKENVLCVNPEADEPTIWELCRKAGLSDFIESHPEGLDMALTAGGNKLSLGIRRRVAIVRALLNNGQLVVFDEPTEGLDSEGCKSVARLLNELTGEGRTLILMSNDPFVVNAATVHLNLDSKPVPEVRYKKQERGDEE